MTYADQWDSKPQIHVPKSPGVQITFSCAIGVVPFDGDEDPEGDDAVAEDKSEDADDELDALEDDDCLRHGRRLVGAMKRSSSNGA